MITTTPSSDAPADRNRAASIVLRVVGALLCLAVAYFHIKDQNGFPGEKGADSATYIQIAYYVVEVLSVIGAGLLLVRGLRAGWVVALVVAAGPMLVYVLSRGPGLPLYTSDRGHWFGNPGAPFTEFLDTASFAVEAVLMLLAAASLWTLRSHRTRS